MAGLARVLFAASVPASPHNPDTDSFRDAGWGVFVHYLWDVQNVGGRENTQGKPPITWDTLVREFDTERFAEQVQENATAGASVRFFTAANALQRLGALKAEMPSLKADLQAVKLRGQDPSYPAVTARRWQRRMS